MGFFNFIETFFFISLGITFVLILLLVYHFKQRICTLEQKGNTMFEIVNGVVKELTNIKRMVLQNSMGIGMSSPLSNSNAYSKTNPAILLRTEDLYNDNALITPSTFQNNMNNNGVVDDTSEYDEDSDEDEDYSDNEDTDEDEPNTDNTDNTYNTNRS